MDREIVEQKLESLRRCLQRIETKCPADAATLVADFDLQDIVSLNLSRAVQLTVDIGAHLIVEAPQSNFFRKPSSRRKPGPSLCSKNLDSGSRRNDVLRLITPFRS